MRVTVHGARPVAAVKPLPRPAASTRPPRRHHHAVRFPVVFAAASAASPTDSIDDADSLTDADRAALDAEAEAIAAGLAEAAEEQGGLLGEESTEVGDDGPSTPSSTTPRTPLRDLPRVALVGRPNVGKSALFNRLLGTRAAIVHDFPGVTRDALCARAAWRGRDFALVDTGGLAADAAALPGAAGAAATAAAAAAGLPAAVERATAAAVAAADAIIVVGDGTTGLTPGETDILTWLRREHARVPTLLAVNKCDNSARAAAAVAEFWEAGVEPWPVSAISGSGTGDLLDAVLGVLPETRSKRKSAGDVDIDDAWWDDASGGADSDPSQRPLRVAIVGRPNAGKSSLLNALTGADRAIVSDVAGTTRDAVDARVTAPDGSTITLVDTAGVRRRTAVAGSPDGAEKLSVGRALAALRRCDVAVLVVDAAACARGGRFVATTQDFRLAELIAAAGRACVIVLNKWDAVPDRGPSTVSDFEADVRASLRPVEWALITHASATARRRVPQVLTAAQAAGAEHGRRLSTATLNLVVRDAVTWRGPPGTKGSPKKGRVYYATQPSTRPPTFVLFVNDPALFPDDYRRYIERSIRTAAGFQGTAVRVVWRGKPKGEAREGGRGERKGGGGRG